MKTREIIIIVIAVVIGAYAALDFFIFSNKKPTSGEDQIRAAVTEIDTFADLSRANLTAVTAKQEFKEIDYLISKAETRLENDPFMLYDSKGAELDEQLEGKELPELAYTGFIKAGKKMLAIINGMEYTIGEMLRDIGYKVFRITSSQVILLTEANKEITLYLEEN